MARKVLTRLYLVRTGLVLSLMFFAVNLGLSKPIPWLYLLCIPGFIPVLKWGKPRHRIMSIALMAFCVFLAGWTWWAEHQRQAQLQKIRDSQEFRIVIPPPKSAP